MQFAYRLHNLIPQVTFTIKLSNLAKQPTPSRMPLSTSPFRLLVLAWPAEVYPKNSNIVS